MNINDLVKVTMSTIKVDTDRFNSKLLYERLDLSHLPLRVSTKPKDLKPGEFAVPLKEKLKHKRLNPRTGRMKKFKTIKWITTTISPEKRTFKNIPKYADGKPKVRFQDWLMLSKTSVSNYSVGKSPNGNWYGWSHRAIGEFWVGRAIKPGIIGNKYEYSEEIEKEHAKIEKEQGNEIADKIIKQKYGNFEPYTIKTDEEAMQHAIRFVKGVS